MIFGDLERLLAQLYPYRVAIAMGCLVVAVSAIAIARRRGWFGAIRRHPRGAAAALAVLVLIGLPLTWSLGSPLFIRTKLVEDLPVAVADASPGPSATAGAIGISDGSLVVIGEGSFMGADEFHFGSGNARLVQTAPGRYVLRFEDFSVRNGPDLFVYLSPSADGYAAGSLELGALKATDGSFNYEIPAGTDVDAFRSAVIWCRAFSVLFATAPFAAT